MSYNPFRLLGASFLAAFITGGAVAQTPEIVMLFKFGGSVQTSPTSHASYESGYGALVGFPNAVSTATSVRLTGEGISQIIPRESPDMYSHDAYFASEAALQSALPDGTYAVSVSGGGTATNTSITLPAGPLPAAPLVTNYTELQNWSGGSFTVTWQPFSGGTANDAVALTIERADGTDIYSTPGFGSAGALNGLATSATVPALSASPGETLYGVLMFIKFSYSFANGGQTIVASGKGVGLRFPIVRALPARPEITIQPRAQTIAAGSAVAFSAGVTGSNLTYQWRRNGVPIVGATSATYLITNTQLAAAGFYTVDVTNASGSVASQAAELRVIVNPSAPSRISNLSIRSPAGVGSDMLIVGLVIGGDGVSGTKPLLMRGVGPGLAPFGVPDFLPDPRLEFYTGSNRTGENDNWGGNAQIAAVTAQIGTFSLGSATTRDAAIYNPTLGSGLYSLQVAGAAGTSGVVLAEIYDATSAASFTATTPRLINVAARTRVGTGANVLIAGFIIDGPTAKTVLIRGIGPTLFSFGVADVLADPKLEIFSGSTLIQSNDNWSGDATLAPTSSSVGAFPLNFGSRDAALIATLPPGNYTAQVSGVAGTTGVGLVEVYEVP